MRLPKRQNIVITVPQPCTQDWDKMTTTEQGKHCSSCNKTVTDFSNYSDKELYDFFKNLPVGVCGHIPQYKLNTLLAAQENKQNTFFKKLFWGTAIASWLGLVTKTDAQGPAKPGTEQTAKTKTNKTPVKQKPDSLKKALTLSFYDTYSKQTIQYVNVTVVIDDAVTYYTSLGGVCNISLPDKVIGKNITLDLYAEHYASKEVTFKVTSLPMGKKISLNYEKVHVMVNGGLAAHPANNNGL